MSLTHIQTLRECDYEALKGIRIHRIGYGFKVRGLHRPMMQPSPLEKLPQASAHHNQRQNALGSRGGRERRVPRALAVQGRGFLASSYSVTKLAVVMGGQTEVGIIFF